MKNHPNYITVEATFQAYPQNAQDLATGTLKVLPKNTIIQSLRGITQDEISRTEKTLGLDTNAFTLALNTLIKQVDATKKS